MIDTPNDMLSDNKETEKSLMVGRKYNQLVKNCRTNGVTLELLTHTCMIYKVEICGVEIDVILTLSTCLETK